MAAEEDSPCSGTVTNECVIMNSGGSGKLVQLEVGEDDEDDEEEDEDDSDGNGDGDQTDEDEDGEDNYGYACP